MSKAKRVARGLAVYGWPDIMKTSIAAEYVGGSRWLILRAVAAGQLKPAGQRARSFTFTKASLDEFMLGQPLEANHATEARIGGKTSRSTATSGDALARLAAIKAGAK